MQPKVERHKYVVNKTNESSKIIDRFLANFIRIRFLDLIHLEPARPSVHQLVGSSRQEQLKGTKMCPGYFTELIQGVGEI